MQQGPAPGYLLALVALEADRAALDRLASAIAVDVARGGEPAADDVAAAADALAWLLASLHAGPVPSASALQVLRDGAGREARAGRPLQPVLDRALTAGWLVWEDATTRGTLSAEGLAALGDALLRTGDAAAAAISDAHAAAERDVATRSASALRELLDDLLELPPADDAGRARLVRRLGSAGIPVDLATTVILVDAGRDLADGDAAVVETARRLGRGSVAGLGDPRALGGSLPGPVTAAAHGRLVVLLPRGRAGIDLPAALDALGAGWVAASADAAGVLAVAAGVREAASALQIAVRRGTPRTVVPAHSVALERAMLAEPSLLRRAVEVELGPLADAPRSAGLVETLEAYLGERENVRAAARRLGVAPRTVSYRLERIERLLGGRLDADRRLRLAAALFARRLI